MFQVGDSGVLESLSLVVDEGAKRAAQGNDGHSSGRLKTWNHADKIAEQDEETERCQEWRVAFAVMADDFFALILNHSLDRLKTMLQSAGAVDRKTGTHEKEQDQQKGKDQKLHGEGVLNRRRGVLDLYVQRPQHRRNRSGEEIVQDLRKPELFRHRTAFRFLILNSRQRRFAITPHEPEPRKARKTPHTRWQRRAKISPQEAHSGSRVKQPI